MANKLPRIYGFTGKARSGKDTAAEYLTERPCWFQLAFADPMKDMLAAIGLSEDQLYGDQKETTDALFGKTPRYMAQTLGTEWGRETIGPDIWVAALHKRILATPVFDAVVVSDVRFENEAAWVREHGQLIHICRHNRDQIDNAGHVSEAGVEFKPGDVLIENNGTKDNLYAALDKVCPAH